MTADQRAAFINAQTALLNAEIAEMVAENANREYRGQAPAYNGDSFAEVRQRYENIIGHNACVGFFRD